VTCTTLQVRKLPTPLSPEHHKTHILADFLEEHPGGAKILKRMAGKDATKQFWKYHNKSVLAKYGEKLKIGTVEEKAKL
jgi:cytochrome b involved in lipid metabolism